MARHQRVKTSNAQEKIIKFPTNIKYLLITNIVLNLVILYFIKFG